MYIKMTAICAHILNTKKDWNLSNEELSAEFSL